MFAVQLMNIHIETQDDTRKLSFLNISNDGADTFGCKAVVKSGWLSCNRQFYFGRYYAEAFLKSLKSMNSFFEGIAELKAEYEDQFIKISCSNMGRVLVTGEFIEHSELWQTVKFVFETDQTVLPSLIKQFEKLVGNHS